MTLLRSFRGELRRASRGFTLLELIVAIIIFSLVIAAAYSLFDSARSMTDRSEFEASIQQEARTVLEILKADLQGAYGSDTLYKPSLVGNQSGGEDTPLYTLKLTSVNNGTTRATTPEIDLTATNYYIDEEPSTEQVGLVRKKDKVLLPASTTVRSDEGLEEIGPDVAYVKFRYWDGASWAETWDSTRTNKLPWAIETTIYIKKTWKGEEFYEKFSSKFWLPMAAETPEMKQPQ